MAANPLAAQIFQLDGAIMFQIRSRQCQTNYVSYFGRCMYSIARGSLDTHL